MQRQSFVRALIGSSAAAVAGGASIALPQTVAPGPRLVDVHHHILPPAWMNVAGPQVLKDAPVPSILESWSPAHDLEEMDQAGVATAITSISTPGLWFGDAAKSRILARACNEYAANMVRTYPGRFGMFAALPLPDVAGSVAEAAYALDTLKANGVGMLTSYGDRWLGDPTFEPVFAELDARRAIVFVHPTVPNCCTAVQPGIQASLAEFLFDTGRCVVSLMFSGTLVRHPNVRFIFTHAGGATAALYNRMIGYASYNKDSAANVPGGSVPAALRTLYFDITGSVSPPTIEALMAIVPTSQIVFGSDHPFLPFARTAVAMEKYGFASDVLTAIAGGNARRLLGLGPN